MHSTLASAIKRTKLVNSALGDETKTYLFITKPEFKPARVMNGKDMWWSCSKTTKAGDHALIYVAGEGISYEWCAISNARQNERWGYVCDVEYVRAFDPPITLQEIRTEFSKESWNPPHQSFRGYKSIIIPNHVLSKIRAMRRMGVRSLQDVEQEFVGKVTKSLKLSIHQRRKRLSSAQRQAARLEVVTTVFLRNPDVVAEVLSRANGYCESCGCAAPFLRASDGSPYLEVHHRVRLSDGGEDTVENALALCPNCHRKAHYG